MTPQSNFTIVAPIAAGRIGDLKTLLASMTSAAGMAKPDNPIVPFGDFDCLHYARFAILDDRTLDDFKAFGRPVPQFPVTLAFLGDCDGPAYACLADLAQRAGPGLRRVFSHCEGMGADIDLLGWMNRHSLKPAAAYVNYRGRTVRQVREEAALRQALIDFLQRVPQQDDDRQLVRNNLLAFVRDEQRKGNLPLTRPKRTPIGWWLRNLAHFLIVPVLLLAAVILIWMFPVLLVALGLLLVILLWMLRRYEKSEPEVIHRPTLEHAVELAKLEDHDVTNQFTVIGSVKPSLFRRWSAAVILWAINYGARHVYNRGFLARIQSIHFARWVFLDGKQRLMFASNYDGSLEAYMDDFINKVGWGLNLAFGGGLGYPRTKWLIKGGSKDEQKFKYTLRRHQVPTQVWYKAYPGLSAFDLARNTRVRKGLERLRMSDAQVRSWLRDL